MRTSVAVAPTEVDSWLVLVMSTMSTREIEDVIRNREEEDPTKFRALQNELLARKLRGGVR